MKRRLLAATPMISIFLFLGAGLVYDNWRIAWTFFLLIPLSVMLLTGNPIKRLSEAMPLIALTIFLWLGFGWDLWNPGWAVFLLIPLFNFIAKGRLEPRKMVSFLVTISFIVIGLTTGSWHPTWIIFLLIPIINTLFFPEPNAFMTVKTFNFKDKVRTYVDAEVDDDDDDFK
ncbi:MAG: hypothetical protein ACNA7K_02795 [Acholeplasmataceae bacterium]